MPDVIITRPANPGCRKAREKWLISLSAAVLLCKAAGFSQALLKVALIRSIGTFRRS